jgi:hypothetical protein
VADARAGERNPTAPRALLILDNVDKTHAQGPSAKDRRIRIFLSYGHDGNEELVRGIKVDLEKRGHDVWFDKSEIKVGDDWRRSITDGIVDSQRVLSFLSKYSTRDPGVCLDEIAIAIGAKGGNIQTILVESEREVKPPPGISHIQWLDMHDWKERRAAGEAAWEQWYQAKLAEIVAVVESDESQRLAGEIKTLEELLKPTTSDFAADARIRKLLEKKLVGRTWLFEAVENWRNTADRAPRLFWIMGAPGIGKSAFAAHLAHEYGRGTVIAVQFCDWKKPDHRDACRIIRTLAFQMATRLPDYRKLLLTLPILTELDRKNSAELFDGLLTNPLKLSITGGRERYLIVIDALDEAGGDGRNELVEVLARYAEQLPDWIGLVVTSRPEFDVTTPFQALKPFPFETKSAANSEDIRAYLRRELAAQLQNRPDPERIVEQILEKSEGVFLYVESLCEDIRKHYLALDRPNEFPQGLAGKFFMDFQRYFPDLEKFRKDVRPALRAILAAREPLPEEILQRLFNWQDEELCDFTRPLRSLFPIRTEGGQGVIKAHHKSLTDWLTDEAKAGAYFVSKQEGHRNLGNHYLMSWQENSTALSEVIYQLTEAKRFEEIAHILFDFRFQETRVAQSHRKFLTEDFLQAEGNSNSYFGLAGVACQLLQFAEEEEESLHWLMNKYPSGGQKEKAVRLSKFISDYRTLFRETSAGSRGWVQEHKMAPMCAKFCRETLLAFAGDLPVVAEVAEILQSPDALRNKQTVGTVRLEIKSAHDQAKKAPRIRANYPAIMADTAWMRFDYIEKALVAAEAALQLQPLKTLQLIWDAQKCHVIADCDMDPAGGIGISVSFAKEEFLEKFTVVLPSAISWNSSPR